MKRSILLLFGIFMSIGMFAQDKIDVAGLVLMNRERSLLACLFK